ncbi:HSP20 family protein [Desulfobaculum xiamenense]|uniref:HSP20 family protein n=1 Tax=Desulfobaculum xiamenense TaxID=995050 RepID=A0A846QLG1_9BACT|nr:Hsp20/alpha crystallin family protein [Desulfobaculum xiamenense]NJB68027.1 HSP20 family protein [Desulfobaculum xiamenense]
MPDLRLWSDRQLSRIKEDMDQLFDSFCMDLGLPSVSCLHADGLEIRKEQDSVTVTLPLPGFSIEDIDVSLTETTLTVTARRESPAGVEGVRRQLQLPCRISTENASAVFKDDVLTIILAKCDPASAKRVAISTR